ncbi:DNA methylase N-4/N-6 [uncultured Caudovirales phage]|uniref:DNA methylase N-4/N-6 n=1 Tax=uncultured Caudovirales phage TaxID=2100421 RepID=A0A6J5LFX8_9CAUD|nr:DNA methylase N-4/N-6 [uncultured Caudovirales phage]
MIELLNMDCMEYMETLPDKAFSLAVVDPPYGLGDRLSDGGGKLKDREYIRQYKENKFDHATPDASYFEELRRVSENQIIWGGNYFDLPPTRGIICWDKEQSMPTFSKWEMGWTSFDCTAEIVRIRSQGAGLRIHPTQKPVALYEWLLANYAKQGQRILDTHLGSGSSAIAAYNLGFDFVGTELDKNYYDASVKRFEQHKAQGSLFEPSMVIPKQDDFLK